MMSWQLMLVCALAILAAVLAGVLVLTLRHRPPGPDIARRRRAAWAAVTRQLLLAAPIRLWALILAGPPLTGLLAWSVYLVRYRWPADRAQQQLEILGLAIYGLIALIAVIVVSLASVKLEAETKLGRLSIGGDHDHDQDLPGSGELPVEDRVLK